MMQLRDWRFWLLIVAAVLLVVAMSNPKYPLSRPVYNYMAVVDITRSMNTRDYRLDGLDVSRLETVRRTLKTLAQSLPCGSRLGLALFTERRASTLLMPVEVCENYAPLSSTIDNIDWRMAWAADSNIIQGLYNTLEMMHDLESRDMLSASLLFMTDGHEAPPPNPNYMPDLQDFQNLDDWKPHGMIVGVGGDELTKIPKYNQDGEMIGYYQADDVRQASHFGLPDDPESIEGYHPRNAPWGNREVEGNEHLSNLKQDYLLELSDRSELSYLRLESPARFAREVQKTGQVQHTRVPVRVHFIPAALALGGIVLLYLVALRRRQ